MILGNVLDLRTYQSPGQTESDSQDSDIVNSALLNADMNMIPLNERMASCYARGVALHLLDWIRECVVVTTPEGNVIDDLPSMFFHQTISSLEQYKENIVDKEMSHHCPFTPELFDRQLENIRSIYRPSWKIPPKQKVDTRFLGIQNFDHYKIRWTPEGDEWEGGNAGK